MQHCFTENEFERGKLHKRNISIIGVLANLPFTVVFFATVCLLVVRSNRRSQWFPSCGHSYWAQGLSALAPCVTYYPVVCLAEVQPPMSTVNSGLRAAASCRVSSPPSETPETGSSFPMRKGEGNQVIMEARNLRSKSGGSSVFLPRHPYFMTRELNSASHKGARKSRFHPAKVESSFQPSSLS